jgi:hypothetical protein
LTTAFYLDADDGGGTRQHVRNRRRGRGLWAKRPDDETDLKTGRLQGSQTRDAWRNMQ